MAKMVRHVSELPDWFNIKPYEQWQDRNIREATEAATRNIGFTCLVLGPYMPPGSEGKELATAELMKISANPYEKGKSFNKIFELHDIQEYGEEKAGEKESARQEDLRVREQVANAAAELLGDQALPSDSGLRHVTLLDIHYWMERNKESLNKLEAKAESIAKENNWELEAVRNLMYDQIPLWDWEGAPFIEVCGLPTMKAEAMTIERYLKKHRTTEDLLTGKNSEVRKLFEYKAVAYYVLTAWAHLEGKTITKKCMASALFPEGPYDSLDMMPTKTVGRFIKRIEDDERFVFHLDFKAREMEMMQF